VQYILYVKNFETPPFTEANVFRMNHLFCRYFYFNELMMVDINKKPYYSKLGDKEN